MWFSWKPIPLLDHLMNEGVENFYMEVRGAQHIKLFLMQQKLLKKNNKMNSSQWDGDSQEELRRGLTSDALLSSSSVAWGLPSVEETGFPTLVSGEYNIRLHKQEMWWYEEIYNIKSFSLYNFIQKNLYQENKQKFCISNN